MDWTQITAYVLGWVIIANTIWVTCQVAFKPSIFDWMIKRPEKLYLVDGSDSPFSKRRAYIHIAGAFSGYFLLFLVVFNLAFSFIPGDWGRLDEDGEFVAASASLAVLASILMTALIWSIFGHAGARSAIEIAAKERLVTTLDELDRASKDRASANLEARRLQEVATEAELNASREKLRYENEITILRSLISSEVLEEHDESLRDEAAAGPRVFYS